MSTRSGAGSEGAGSRRVPRPWVLRALVLALLVGAAGAFALSEALKLRPVAFTFEETRRVFSPSCECGRSELPLAVEIERPETIDAFVVDSEDRRVRTLADDEHVRRRASFAWDGTDDDGAVVPDGRYRLSVRVVGDDRAATSGRAFRVDTTPPDVTLVSLEPRAVVPGKVDAAVAVTVEVREAWRVAVLVDGRAVLRDSRLGEGTHELAWEIQGGPRAPSPGVHEVVVRARDRAGNSAESGPLPLRVRRSST